ncbi:Phosphatidylinositol-4-phosphate_5-kinase [Hexamita inflata]|uniref:Putative n=1 Tax=Hexamita inflata TaxID=28002 RepID=A0AA86P990_9EUKA|nr:Phosphatidylinositol-4-phosphate 5-kinase [Hexamita inflata]
MMQKRQYSKLNLNEPDVQFQRTQALKCEQIQQFDLNLQKTNYIGEKDQNGKPHGSGTLTSENSISIVGMFEHGMKVGSCKLIDKNGQYIIADFADDVLQMKIEAKQAGKWTFIVGDETNGYIGSYSSDQYNYEGPFDNVGLFHGDGEVKFKNGYVYKGTFQKGNRHGKGVEQFNNILTESLWENDEIKQKIKQTGPDFVLTYGNGTESDGYENCIKKGADYEYVGNIFQDKYHGQGILTMKDGTKFTGVFKSGCKHGQFLISKSGTWEVITFNEDKEIEKVSSFANKVYTSYKNNEPHYTYSGPLQNNVPHGQGVLNYMNKSVYTGRLQNGERHDNACTFESSLGKYVGSCLNNGQSGQGLIDDQPFEFVNGSLQFKTKTDFYEFKGDLINGFPSTGTFTFNSKILDAFEGQIKSIKKQLISGNGTLKFKNKEQFKGTIINNELENEGQITRENGEILIGTFKKSTIQGQGKSILNGITTECIFDKGKPIGNLKIIKENGNYTIGSYNGPQLVSLKEVVENDFNYIFEAGNEKDKIYTGKLIRNDLVVTGQFSQPGLKKTGRCITTLKDSVILVADYDKDELVKIIEENKHGKQIKYSQYSEKIQEGTIIASEYTYTGSILNKMRHGKGETKYASGITEISEYFEDKLNGHTKTIQANGDIQECEYSSNEMKRLLTGKLGDSEISLVDNDKYKIVRSDSIYEGEANDGVPHGYGTLTLDNRTQTGSFKNGKLHGMVTTEFKNGSKRVDVYVDGEFSEQSEIISSTGTTIKFLKGSNQQQLKAQIIYKSGESYSGEVSSKYQREGFGEMKYLDGERAKGYWKQDCFHGQVQRFFPSGDQTLDFYNMNQLTHRKTNKYGQILTTYLQGDVTQPFKAVINYPDATYEGDVDEDGTPNGRGYMRFKNGDLQEGIFKDGELYSDYVNYQFRGYQYRGSFYGGISGEGTYRGDKKAKWTDGVLQFNIPITEAMKKETVKRMPSLKLSDIK